jgi:hypothetical protein
MKAGQFLFNPASAIALAALLALPMHSLAQSNDSPFGGRAPRPVCVYKGVMSDAEIEVCTGYRVRYSYDVYSGPTVAEAREGPTVREVSYSRTGAQATYSGRAPRATRN